MQIIVENYVCYRWNGTPKFVPVNRVYLISLDPADDSCLIDHLNPDEYEPIY